MKSLTIRPSRATQKRVKKNKPFKNSNARLFQRAAEIMAGPRGGCGACLAISDARKEGDFPYESYASKHHKFFGAVFQQFAGLCDFGGYVEENRTPRVIALCLAAILAEEGFETEDFK